MRNSAVYSRLGRDELFQHFEASKLEQPLNRFKSLYIECMSQQKEILLKVEFLSC